MTLEEIGNRPVRILQFGQGNFLRAFYDVFIQKANENGTFDGSVVIIKPTNRGNLDDFHAQQCHYTVLFRGIVDGVPKTERVPITCIKQALGSTHHYDKYMSYAHCETLEYVVSNTTEAGIVFDCEDRFDMTPPDSFPAKVTKFLFERFQYFNGDNSKGLIFLPTELIEFNGNMLKECILKYSDKIGRAHV